MPMMDIGQLNNINRFPFIEEREQKLTLIFCNITIITPLRANIEQTQIIPYYPLTKRAKRNIKNL